MELRVEIAEQRVADALADVAAAASRWLWLVTEPRALAAAVCAAVILLMMSDSIESTTVSRDVVESAVLRVRVERAERRVIGNRDVRARRVVARFVDPVPRRHLPLGGRELLGGQVGIRLRRCETTG